MAARFILATVSEFTNTKSLRSKDRASSSLIASPKLVVRLLLPAIVTTSIGDVCELHLEALAVGVRGWSAGRVEG